MFQPWKPELISASSVRFKAIGFREDECEKGEQQCSPFSIHTSIDETTSTTQDFGNSVSSVHVLSSTRGCRRGRLEQQPCRWPWVKRFLGNVLTLARTHSRRGIAKPFLSSFWLPHGHPETSTQGLEGDFGFGVQQPFEQLLLFAFADSAATLRQHSGRFGSTAGLLAFEQQLLDDGEFGLFDQQQVLVFTS